ncbi:hypothetical protein VNO77_16747 [Canavalia gladiata]|uniref:Uncharacterized protein n=1 Tax=Canavalia gladiata TaxID=3824 RepID=A0AAN9QM04_CANGL
MEWTRGSNTGIERYGAVKRSIKLDPCFKPNIPIIKFKQSLGVNSYTRFGRVLRFVLFLIKPKNKTTAQLPIICRLDVRMIRGDAMKHEQTHALAEYSAKHSGHIRAYFF